MRVIRQLFAAVALAVLAAAPSVAQESQGAVLDARIANWSLDNELARRASDIRDCEADPVDRLICALGRAGASPIEREEARWLLTMSLQALDLGADPQMTSEFYLIAGASALALYRLDACPKRVRRRVEAPSCLPCRSGSISLAARWAARIQRCRS